MKNILVLSGAGISAESGISTFRDADGLWEGHNVMAVASPQGWETNPQLVLQFYNERRRQLLSVEPNIGHMAITQLAEQHHVQVITQNVDDLHERAGNPNVLHLHGELLKAQSTIDDQLVYSWKKDIRLGDKCELGGQLRPFIVWFGEMVPMLEMAITHIEQADAIIIVGTSMQVYPAASLASYAKVNTPIYYIDPKPAINEAINQLTNMTIINQTATQGLPYVIERYF